LRERLVVGAEAVRRRNALDWVERLRHDPTRPNSWETRPQSLDESHWRDLLVGAKFFATRDAAIKVLDEIEAYIANRTVHRMSLDTALPKAVNERIKGLRKHAQEFLGNGHDPTADCSATAFCRECIERDDTRLLERLLAREGRVLRLRDREIVPGVAYRGAQDNRSESGRSPEDAGTETEVEHDVALPEYISRRVRNLFLLNLDLRGQLGEWLR
jgi:hypothetical protein